ncbi:hypothetical protein GCM10023216_18880 [Isoptericola chiayiensis]|uniref:Uncharacterized protein n=1 Tax=Isoptericola chiayiensis TaxID=579446 RepID=A0ABP8YER4_9MICO|nr:hypothetical protein [Isoptericola chiayiensis]NOW00115.1 hypothetical protein [Isoptericola chiayiensis]
MSKDTEDPDERRWRALLDESIASQARIAPKRRSASDPHGDPRTGGDATKAPNSLSQSERRPMEGASSGHSWDDPDEL